MVKVTFTGERFTEASLEEGMPVESGYVNLDWSRHEIMADGDAWAAIFDTREEAEQFIRDAIGDLEPSGDSYYAIDTVMDSNGDHWSYAGHIEE